MPRPAESGSGVIKLVALGIMAQCAARCLSQRCWGCSRGARSPSRRAALRTRGLRSEA